MLANMRDAGLADGLAAVLAATPTVAERARETVERTAQVIESRFLFCFWFKLRLHDENTHLPH